MWRCVFGLAVVVGSAAVAEPPAAVPHATHAFSRLPDDPRIAAYLLGRKSGDELLALMRSPHLGHPTIVFDEVLSRDGITPAAHREAIVLLAEINDSTTVAEWTGAIERAANRGEHVIVQRLGRELLAESRESLAGEQRLLSGLAYGGSDDRSRSIGWAALLLAAEDPRAILAAARPLTGRTLDCLAGVTLAAPVSQRIRLLREDVSQRLASANHVTLRRNAITALAACDPSAKTIRELLPRALSTAHSKVDRLPALYALGTIPVSEFDRELADGFLTAFADHAEACGAAHRAGREFRAAVRHAKTLLPLLPDQEADTYRKRIAAREVTTVTVRAVRQEMRFDRTRIDVPAGRAVEIVFENDDDLPQNLVVVAPGSIEEIGRLADAMQGREAFDRGFVPDSPKVIIASKLLDARERASIVFEPRQPGRYPFTSTIAEHWRNMRGVIHVTAPKE